jgi:hypothetical protein
MKTRISSISRHWRFGFSWSILVSVLLVGPLARVVEAAAASTPSASPAPASPRGMAVPSGDGFEFRDYIGRKWSNELVSFPLTKNQREFLKAGRTLIGPDGKPVPCQVVEVPGKEAELYFQVDLDPFQTRVYSWSAQPVKVETDLVVEETPEVIRLSNRLTGISVRKEFKSGPVEAIRLNCGVWVGGSYMEPKTRITKYSAAIVNQGPVFEEVVCRAEKEEGRWEMRFRVMRNEPVVLVEESFSLGEDAGWNLTLGQNWEPGYLLFRYGMYVSGEKGIPLGQVATHALEANPKNPNEAAFTWDPWLQWQHRAERNTWFGVYHQEAPDLLAIGAREPSFWINPEQREENQATIPVPLVVGTFGPTLKFPLTKGQRKWMISIHPKEACLAEVGKLTSPLPQKYLIKHGDFPLNRVKDYVLSWPVNRVDYPHLFVRKADIPALSDRFPDNESAIPNLVRRPLNLYDMERYIRFFLTDGESEMGEYMINTTFDIQKRIMDELLEQKEALITLGCGHIRAQEIHAMVNLSDLILGSSLLNDDDFHRTLARLAFLGYTLNRPDMWSPERGFCNHANMTTTHYSYLLGVASVIPNHPAAKEWTQGPLKEFREELDTWSDDNGGWAESPHYSAVSIHSLFGALIRAKNTGLSDMVYDPRLRKAFEWLAKISTPPDRRYGGYRHLPHVGNTYIGDTYGDFSVMAYLWKDKDPVFASQMQWVWREHGSWPTEWVGGASMALMGFRKLLTDPDLPAKPPAYKSELFPQTGTILRNHFPSDRETQLYIIHGTNHGHYDDDSGSITIWGKGRCVSDDFGYYGYATPDDASMIEAGTAEGLMKYKDFATFDRFDYFSGVKQLWTRQIVFMKDPDPMGPNYFVVGDRMQNPATFTWRLWLAATEVTLQDSMAHVRGGEDVDTDVAVFSSEKLQFKTEEKSRTSVCGRVKGIQNPVKTTQIGLIASTTTRTKGLITVIYPRLNSEPGPTITPLAQNQGVKVEGKWGTDYIFANTQPIKFNEGPVQFEGKVGAVQIRGKKVVLSLGTAGAIAAMGQVLKSEKACSKEF